MRGGRRPVEGRGSLSGNRGRERERERGKVSNAYDRNDWGRGRSRRSLSPHSRKWNKERERRSPSPRRDTSVERRGYEAPRYVDRGKQIHRNEDVDRDGRGGGGRQLTLEKDYYEGPPNYMLPEHPSGLKLSASSAAQLGISSFPSVKDRDRDAGYLDNSSAAPSARFEIQSTLPQRSLFVDDFAGQDHYSRVTKATYAMDIVAVESAGGVGSSRYLNVGTNDYKNELNDPYNHGKGRAIYSEEMANNPVVGPSNTRVVATVPSTSIARDELLGLYDGHIRQSLDTFERSNRGKLADGNLDKEVYTRVQLSGALTKDTRDENNKDARLHGYQELMQKGRDNYRFHDTDATYKKIPSDSQDEMQYRLSSSFPKNGQGRTDELYSSKRSAYEINSYDQYDSLHRDATSSYHKTQDVHDDYDGGFASEHIGLRMRSRIHEYTSQDEIYDLEQDTSHHMSYIRQRSPALSSRHISMYERPITSRRNLDLDTLPSHHVSPYERPVASPRVNSDMDDHYDLYSNRMVRRGYILDDRPELQYRRISRDNLTNFGRSRSVSPDYEMEPKKHIMHSLAARNKRFAYSKYRRTSHADFHTQLPARGSPRYEEYDHPRNLKRRLKHGGPSEFYGSHPSDRRKEYFRPKKMWKADLEEGHGGSNAHDIDDPDEDVVLKSDPPEDSEEFKKQVDRAFLQYSKMLNESHHERKKYQQQGQGSSLLCCVCESLSKKFSDAHCLATHAYNSLRVGLRTKHLGLHKAICVLMGWNSLVAPTVTKSYQTLPATEAKALKEDLILWPPLVVIHDISISNKANSSSKRVMTIESIEKVLKDMGYGASNPKVCLSNAEDGSIFLVKFSGTFSGFQEAERLHKHFANQNRGKEEFVQSSSGNSIKGKDESGKRIEELLYGYMALVEDLHKLDDETKKRSVVKSKKAIEAIADEALNVD